eukprot:CAMPEP_0175081772 /NCGR_PEP_ID=MMETSP0052_2-20121109/26351_1 /TAXON_ID=51329 ORGANISM="Polytomella parva, Strain SAG 63-3" /NCGR_SAMPLE_ID=MMETSP0052_2 /ASSEMBLY_ACC=CAM_ASM_000194 /LENGTH=34 /DNA_ID= /DNA_START= /DNA_END= /DNA_ORIENTATION=
MEAVGDEVVAKTVGEVKGVENETGDEDTVEEEMD